jgi:nucleotide-binding universal stress UspA family protein
MNLPRTILVPTDFSESAEYALDYAVQLAAKLDGRILLLNAIGTPALGVPELGLAVTSTMMESLVKGNSAELDKLATSKRPAKIETLLRSGDARDVIVLAAKEFDADLIVMGTHGRRGVSRALLGSVAEGVVRAAPCPVLTIRMPKTPSDADPSHARDARPITANGVQAQGSSA